jgi:hypothetical protein
MVQLGKDHQAKLQTLTRFPSCSDWCQLSSSCNHPPLKLAQTTLIANKRLESTVQLNYSWSLQGQERKGLTVRAFPIDKKKKGVVVWKSARFPITDCPANAFVSSFHSRRLQTVCGSYAAHFLSILRVPLGSHASLCPFL